MTDFRGPIYADPTRKLYRTLGMTIETFQVTPAGTERKSYLRKNRLSNALHSIWVRVASMGFLESRNSHNYIGIGWPEDSYHHW